MLVPTEENWQDFVINKTKPNLFYAVDEQIKQQRANYLAVYTRPTKTKYDLLDAHVLSTLVAQGYLNQSAHEVLNGADPELINQCHDLFELLISGQNKLNKLHSLDTGLGKLKDLLHHL